MTEQSSSDDIQTDDHPDQDVENDAVIGSAFRASLIALMLLGLPIIGLLVYLNLQQKEEEEVVVDVINPDVRSAQQEVPKLTLTDVSALSGIDFQHESGRYGDKLLPETMGSGIAVLDYNGDGNQDLLCVNSSHWPWDTTEAAKQPSPCKLFAGDGKFGFKDVSAAAGLDFTTCLLYTSPSPRDQRGSRMPSSA